MIILHFLATKDIKMCYREEFIPGDMFPRFRFCASRTAPKHCRCTFPRSDKEKLEKDHGKCLNCLRNIMYDMLSFLLQADLLSQCLFEGLYYKS